MNGFVRYAASVVGQRFEPLLPLASLSPAKKAEITRSP